MTFLLDYWFIRSLIDFDMEKNMSQGGPKGSLEGGGVHGAPGLSALI